METQIKSKIKEKSRTQSILEWLQAGKTLTNSEARNQIGEYYLKEAIAKLRNRGYKIYFHYPSKKYSIKEGYYVMGIEYQRISKQNQINYHRKYEKMKFGACASIAKTKFHALLDYLKNGNKVSNKEVVEVFKMSRTHLGSFFLWLKLNGYKYKVEYTKSKNNKKIALYSLDKDETNN